MGRFEGTYLKLASYRDAYIAATQAVERAGSRVEAVKTRMMLGDKAADAIVEAAKDGAFLSKDDFRQRTKVSKTVVDLMASLNLLGNLPESNQISLFDFVS